MQHMQHTQDNWLARLAQCLDVAAVPTAASASLLPALQHACALGATPFEVIAGTPVARYGPRVTLIAGPSPTALAAHWGLHDHPYGPASWIGLRIQQDGQLHAKAYHKFSPELIGPGADGGWPLPAALPVGLVPVMAARDGDAYELYLRLKDRCSWADFSKACLALLPTEADALTSSSFSPWPQPAAGAFCVSLRWQHRHLSAITLYADQRALPDDAQVRAQWSCDMSEHERHAYEMAFHAVRGSGPRRAPWHAMLAWSVDVKGQWHRAASLRVPRPRTDPRTDAGGPC